MCTISYYLTLFFFFNDTATTEISPLSLHDALPISFQFAAGTAGGLGRVNSSRNLVIGLSSCLMDSIGQARVSRVGREIPMKYVFRIAVIVAVVLAVWTMLEPEITNIVFQDELHALAARPSW